MNRSIRNFCIAIPIAVVMFACTHSGPGKRELAEKPSDSKDTQSVIKSNPPLNAVQEEPPLANSSNPWTEEARQILIPDCGVCHLPTNETSKPRALAVYDLLQAKWYENMTHEQLQSLQRRIQRNSSFSEEQTSVIDSFVRCEIDGQCNPAGD